MPHLENAIGMKGGGTVIEVLQISWSSWLSALVLGVSLGDERVVKHQYHPRGGGGRRGVARDTAPPPALPTGWRQKRGRELWIGGPAIRTPSII